jgi:translation initiation factor IF-2
MNNNKIIHLKPPIIVRELAKLIEIQPFQLIHDLMDMNVFATRNQTIKPEGGSGYLREVRLYFGRNLTS